MGKIIEFKSKNNKEEVERIAEERFGIIKIDENIYLAPDFSRTVGSTDSMMFNEEIGDSSDYLEPEIISELNNLVGSESDYITILVKSKLHDNFKLLEIFSKETNKTFTMKIQSSLDDKRKYLLVGIIANAINTVGVRVCMYSFKTYDEIKELI